MAASTMEPTPRMMSRSSATMRSMASTKTFHAKSPRLVNSTQRAPPSAQALMMSMAVCGSLL